MTTTVIVHAHCDAETKKVEVNFSDRVGSEKVYLEDEDSFEFVVYDERSVTVREVEKSEVVEEPVITHAQLTQALNRLGVDARMNTPDFKLSEKIIENVLENN